MKSHQAESENKVKASILPQRESHFSWLRTRLSTERTLMSWVWNDEFKDIAGIEERADWTPLGLVPIMLAIVGVGTFGGLLLRTISN